MVHDESNPRGARVPAYAIGERRDAVVDAVTAAARGGRRAVEIVSTLRDAEVVLLAVSAVSGITPDVQTQLRDIKSAGVPPVVVALDDIDRLDDPELLDLAELEVREFVRRSGYSTDVAVVKLSTRKIVRDSARAQSRIEDLLDAIDAALSVHR
jgi:translation elongation factor EF-Tu-like GTPase